jgi:NodT family efflux transporter outer membrane factor (OMF) lipoprotein
MVGPNYTKPQIRVPTQWAQAPATQPSSTQSSTTQTTLVDETSPPADWWVTLGDAKLDSLVRRAWQENLDVRVATSRILEARASRSIAAGGLFPSVVATGSYDFNRANGPLFPVKSADYNFYATGFDAVWEADLFGGVRRSVEAAQADLESQEDARRGVLVSVVAEVARNYVELRTAQQRVIISKANIQIQRESFDVASRLNAAGIVSDLDVSRARAELTQTESDIPALEIQEKAAIHQLGILLGQSPQSLMADLEAPGMIPAPAGPVPIGLPSELLRRRPDVRQVERQLAAATARIGVAEADLYPQLTLTGDFGVGGQQPGNLFNWSNRYVGVGPAVRWQLFEGGRIVANIDAHRAIRQELLDQYKLTILVALRETADALISFNRRQTQFDLLTQSVASNRDSVRIASARYSSGTIDYLTLLDTQRSLLKAQDAATVSQGDISLSLIALYKAIGGGWENSDVTK